MSSGLPITPGPGRSWVSRMKTLSRLALIALILASVRVGSITPGPNRSLVR